MSAGRDPRARADRDWAILCGIVSVVAHVALAVALRALASAPPRPTAPPARAPMEVFDVEPPAMEAPPVPERVTAPATRRSPARTGRAPATPSVPDRSGAAAAVMTAEPVESASLDFVTGSAGVYMGGSTRSDGVGDGARASARDGEPMSGVRNLARGATLSDGAAWSCPFPAEALASGVDQAVATLSIRVAPNGRASAVEVTGDPGHGFGAAARSCAWARRYLSAQDSAGRAIEGVIVVNVRFLR